MTALAEHRTQVEADGPFFSGGESGHAFWGEEFYRIVRGTPGARTTTASRRTCSPACEALPVAAVRRWCCCSSGP